MASVDRYKEVLDIAATYFSKISKVVFIVEI
jgi:hypothetical protein